MRIRRTLVMRLCAIAQNLNNNRLALLLGYADKLNDQQQIEDAEAEAD